MKFTIAWLLTLITREHCMKTNLKGPPKFEEANRNLKVIKQEGKDVNLRCPITGIPHPLFTWKKDEPDYSRIISNKKTLRIDKAKLTDSGEYICKATNGYGNLEIKIELMIVLSQDLTQIKKEINKIIIPGQKGNHLMLENLMLKFKDFELICIHRDIHPKPSPYWYESLPEFQQDRAETITKEINKNNEAIYACKTLGNDTSLEGSSDVNPSYFKHPEERSISLSCISAAMNNHTVLLLKDLSHLPFAHRNSVISNEERILMSMNYFKKGHKYKKVKDLHHNILQNSSPRPLDSGLYICLRFSGRKGMEVKTFYLKIIRHSAMENDKNGQSTQVHFAVIILLSVIISLLISYTVSCLNRNILKKLRRINSESITTLTSSIYEEKVMKQETPKQEKIRSYITKYQIPKNNNFKEIREQNTKNEVNEYELKSLHNQHNEYCTVADARIVSFRKQSDVYVVPIIPNSEISGM